VGVGLVPTRKSWGKEKTFSLTVLVSVIGIYLILGIFGMLFVVRFMELAILAAILFAGIRLSEFKMNKTVLLQLSILLVSVLVIFSSSELNKMKFTGKITPEEAEFAFAFEDFDPSLQKTFFLSSGDAKIAEYSNKIPYDTNRGWFLPYHESQVFHDSGFEEMKSKHKIKEDIIANQCVQCILDLDIKYLVINRDEFNMSVNREVGFKHGNFEVYVT